MIQPYEPIARGRESSRILYSRVDRLDRSDEVRRSTAKLLEGMTADGGGYILAGSHTIPPETPAENIFALFAEAGVSRKEIFDRAAQIRAARGTS